MLRNYIAVALRNMVRNKLYAAINIIGLATGLAAALFVALFVRDELSYDKWIPENDRAFLVSFTLDRPGLQLVHGDVSPPTYAGWFKLDFPEIQVVARLVRANVSLRHRDIEADEEIVWADPDFFDIVKLPAIAGNANAALRSPDGIVLTRSIAYKYFGRADPLGETIDIDRSHAMRVMAIIEDLPSNTHIKADVFASGLASFSELTRLDALPPPGPVSAFTYLKLVPGASIDTVRAGLEPFFARHTPDMANNPRGVKVTVTLLSLADIHLSPGNLATMKPRGDLATIYLAAVIGLLIVIVASINFVNLMTARASRRGLEIGVRKVLGAARWNLVVQFVGEAVAYTVLSLAIAAIAGALILPMFNAFLGRAVTLDLHSDSVFAFGFLAAALGIGVMAGVYPAFVLSAFNPARVLKSGASAAPASAILRQVLVVFQFAVLIGLVAATGVVYRQTNYAFEHDKRLDTDQVLTIQGCVPALRDRLVTTAGVRAAACSSPHALNIAQFSTVTVAPDGRSLEFARAAVGFGFFELYGVQPVAGRLFLPERGDAVPDDKTAEFSAPLIINETAARALGFESPAAAVGRSIAFMRTAGLNDRSEIIGVVPDFALDTVHHAVQPTAYFVNFAETPVLSVKLSGGTIPATLATIDRLWKEFGEPHPIRRSFLNDRVQDLYRDLLRQTQFLMLFGAITLFIACLGLFGLSAFTAEQRTKEIGIRKAMGARRADILRLLIGQFTKPVLWANVIAWPAVYFIMRRWLEGFAYHIDLSVWMFLGASALALGIAY